jgi:hypothetical protein
LEAPIEDDVAPALCNDASGTPRSMPATVQAIRTYLDEVARLRGTGQAVAETSYYPAVHQLLSDIGANLTPRRTAIQHPALGSYGGGMPDNAPLRRRHGRVGHPGRGQAGGDGFGQHHPDASRLSATHGHMAVVGS